jgi:hypothetical protein
MVCRCGHRFANLRVSVLSAIHIVHPKLVKTLIGALQRRDGWPFGHRVAAGQQCERH